MVFNPNCPDPLKKRCMSCQYLVDGKCSLLNPIELPHENQYFSRKNCRYM